MPRIVACARVVIACIALLSVLGFYSSVAHEVSPLTIRLAGDEWFLDSLTKTGLIADFEQKSGIHVEVLHKNDRTIMSDLDRGPNSTARRWT